MRDIRHTGIYVQNLELMKDFYCKYFSMNIAIHAIEESKYIDTVLGLVDCKIELYKLQTKDGSMLELLKYLQDDSENIQREVYECGSVHLAMTVKNVDEIYKRLNSDGVVFISTPQFSADGTAKVCFCQDPEGHYIEVVEEL